MTAKAEMVHAALEICIILQLYVGDDPGERIARIKSDVTDKTG